MKKHIPNIITLGNLLCGCLAVIAVFNSKLELAAYLVLGGAFLDFFDGLAARLLKVSGELGKQLDSLADMVTFGLVPGLIGCHLLGFLDQLSFLSCIPLIMVLMSAMRLAMFNISTDQYDGFIGVPTPSNALLWIGLPSTLVYVEIDNKWLIISLSIVMSCLLVSRVRLLALKFKSYGWIGNEYRWLLIAVCLTSALGLTILTGNLLVSLPIIILLYLLISIVHNSFSKK